jgi:hypothetical protein
MTSGMLAIGLKNPNSKNAGKKVAVIAIWLANNWLLVTSIPSSPMRHRIQVGATIAMNIGPVVAGFTSGRILHCGCP